MGRFQNLYYSRYREADTVNEAGGKAWTMPIEDRFTQVMNTGGLFNTYYVEEKKLFKEAEDSIKEYLGDSKNHKKAVDIMIAARNTGFMRHMPVLALSTMASIVSEDTDTELIAKAFNAIINTPRDLIDFIDIVRSKRGLGRSIKKLIGGYVNRKLNQFYAMKYKDQLRVAAKLSHVKPKDEMLMKYIFGDPEGVEIENYPQLHALELLKKGEINATQAIMEHRLEYQTVVGIRKPEKDEWEAIGKQMSGFQLIKNLATLERHIGADKTRKIVEENLSAERLSKSKVIPFRVFQAMDKVNDSYLKRAIMDVADQYPKLYDFGDLGRVMIAPDVSGSMGYFSNVNGVSYMDKAATLAGIMGAGIKMSYVQPWSNNRDYDKIVGTSVSMIRQQLSTLYRGGTDMGYFVRMARLRKEKIDTFIAITDNEHWCNKGFYPEWLKYKKFHKTAKAILIRIDTYNTQQFPAEIAVKMDITQIFGWGDNILKIIKYQGSRK